MFQMIVAMVALKNYQNHLLTHFLSQPVIEPIALNKLYLKKVKPCGSHRIADTTLFPILDQNKSIELFLFFNRDSNRELSCFYLI